MANQPKKFDIDYEQKEDMRKYAKVLPFGDVVKAYKEANPNEELTGEKLHAFINEEVKAIKKAFDDKADNRKQAYETDDNGSPRKNKVNFVSDYFAAEDRFSNNQDSYNEYLSKRAEIEKTDDENEKNIALRELDDRYKDAIASYEKCKELSETAEKYRETIEFLDDLPDKVLQNIIDTKDNCDERGDKASASFEKAFADMVSQPDYKTTKEDDGKTLINEHRFNAGTNTNVVTHTVHNVDGSGLALTFTDGKFSIAWTDENMTQDQLNAFALYCYRCGITIENFGDLEGKKVVDKDNNEIGDVKTLFEEATKKHEEDNNKSRQANVQFAANGDNEGEPFNENSGNNEEKGNNNTNQPVSPTGGNTNQPDNQDVDVPINGSFFGPFIPENGKIKSFDIETVRSSTQKILPNGAVMDFSNGFGTTTLSVYPSKEDQEEDGKIDKKYHRKHTKSYAITFNHFNNSATFYLGPKGKLDAGVIRIALDQAKAQGYKYFEIPPVKAKNGFGAGANPDFFKASVKTRMPLLLKGPSGRGCDIGAGDVKDILKLMNEDGKEFEGKENEKVEYLMRFHQQLEKYTNTTKKHGEFSEVMETVKQQANFEHFKNTHKPGLVTLINDGVDGKNGEKWDQVDVICAISAYDNILKDIMKGRLGGKRFNPMDAGANEELIKKEFDRYRKKERQKVEDKIDETLEFLTKDNTSRDMRKNAIDSVKKDYLGGESRGLTKTLKSLERYGVSINIDFNKIDGSNYNPKDRKTERSSETQRNIDNMKNNTNTQTTNNQGTINVSQMRNNGGRS